MATEPVPTAALSERGKGELTAMSAYPPLYGSQATGL